MSLKLKDITDTQKYDFYIGLHIDADNGGRLKIKFYDKRIDFIFPIVNFPFISNNIPASSAYGVDISHLIRYSRVCAQYSDFPEKSLAAKANSTATRLRCS